MSCKGKRSQAAKVSERSETPISGTCERLQNKELLESLMILPRDWLRVKALSFSSCVIKHWDEICHKPVDFTEKTWIVS